MSKGPEEKFKDNVEKYLDRHHILHYRNNMGFNSGYPDITAIHRGYYVGIELKREDGKGRASGSQLQMIRWIREAGGVAGVVASIDDLKQLLKEVEIQDERKIHDSSKCAQ